MDGSRYSSLSDPLIVTLQMTSLAFLFVLAHVPPAERTLSKRTR